MTGRVGHGEGPWLTAGWWNGVWRADWKTRWEKLSIVEAFRQRPVGF